MLGNLAGRVLRSVTLCCVQFLGAVLVSLLLMTGAGQAQNVDWLLNLEDTGYDPTPAGGSVLYTVRISNNGLDKAPVTGFEIDVPANATLLSVSGATNLSCPSGGAVALSTMRCTLSALQPMQEASATLAIRSEIQGDLSLATRVDIAGDVDTANNAATEVTTINAGTDLDIAISGPVTAAAGSTVAYSFTVTNNGPNALDRATLQFPDPSGLTGITSLSGCSDEGARFSCDVGSIAVGADLLFDFSARVAASEGSFVSPAGSVSNAYPLDPVSGNNTDAMNTAVTAGTDLAITKTRSIPGMVLTDQQVSFTLSGSYTGDSPTNIQITDSVPSNYRIDSVVPDAASSWVCGYVGQNVTCDMATGLGSGGDISLGDITINTTVMTAGNVTNTAYIAADSPTDPDPSNNSDSDSLSDLQDPFIDLVANKTGPDPALGVVGNTYEFPLSVTNAGNDGFYGTIELTDALPEGLTYRGYSGTGWSCDAAPVVGPASVVCRRVYSSLSPLAAGATTPIVTIEAEATLAQRIVNNVMVYSPDGNRPEHNPGNDTASYTIDISSGPLSADISLVKTRGSATVAAGDVQTYSLEIVNDGPDTAENVVVTDALNSLINDGFGLNGYGLVSLGVLAGNTGEFPACTETSTGSRSLLLSCSISSVPVCTQGVNCAVINFSVRPGGNAGSRTNTASVISSTVADPDLSNNEDSVNFNVEARADVTVGKVATPDPVPAGQNLTYVVSAINQDDGHSAAENVTITDTLPNNAIFISATPSNGSCSTMPAIGAEIVTGSNDQLVCNLGTINNGAQRTVTVELRPLFAYYGGSISNSASVSTTTIETDGTNNTVSISTPVGAPEVDLLVNKVENTDPVTMEFQTTYTITVQNTGPSHAEDVRVVDTMPAADISFVSHTIDADGSCSTVPAAGSFGGTLECSFPRLEAGETRQIQVVAEGEAKGVATNTVTVSSLESLGGFDSNMNNNTADETTTVRTRVNLNLTKVAQSTLGAAITQTNVRDDFQYLIRITNPTGVSLAEADIVEMTDTLPANMELVGPPSVAVISGTASDSSCTGVAGGTSVFCEFGTISSGGVVEITVPVQVTGVSARPASFVNTASVDTYSYDIDTSDNSDSATVSIYSSTLSGTLFRDFNDDGAQIGTDTGIAGVTMTITGTTYDGAAFTTTATTDVNGDYTFQNVPEGSYSVTRGTPSESYLEDGIDTVGSVGGTLSGPAAITLISIPANSDVAGYNFAMVPQARIGLAKALQTQTVNADGSFTAPFRIEVENFSLEALNSITVTDALQGAAPLFGTHVTLGTPSTDAMAAGTYTMLTTPMSTCGASNPAYNGAGNQTLASGITLAAGGICQIDFTIRVQPTAPLPAAQPGGHLYENQAAVEGTGVLSGQSYPTNPMLRDLSDNGTNPDANANGRGDDANEDDPTPVSTGVTQTIALVKTVDTSALQSPPQVGDTLTYSFTVTNTGNVNVSNINIVDTSLPGMVFSPAPIALLTPGQSSSAQLATYALTQPDIDAGVVTNTASASGTGPYGDSVSDTSGTAAGNDTPTEASITQSPELDLVKTISGTTITDPTVVGQTISYAFTVTNTGNVTLTGVDIADTLPGIVLSGTPIATMAPGASDSTTFTATYAVTQADIDTGEVRNRATATGTPPSGPDVSDDSGTSTGTDTDTVQTLHQNPSIALVKTADDSGFSTPPTVGDQIAYSFAITNTGNVTQSNVTLSDILTDIVLSGGPIVSLAPGVTDNSTFTATYALKQSDIDAGQVVNHATTTGTPPSGPNVSDDSGSAVTNDTPTTTTISQSPSIALIKSADISALSNPPVAGEIVTFRFAITNTGNVTLSNVLLNDPLVGLTVTPGPIVTLAPGATDNSTYVGTYALTQDDVDAGELTNQAATTGTPPTGADVTDTSGTTLTSDDPTTTNFTQSPAIDLVKTVDTSGLSAPPSEGDVLTYAFTVTNIGNVTLTNVTVADALPGLVLSGAPIATMVPGQVDSTTYTASYTLTQADVDAGEVRNRATATGTPPTGGDVTDDSGTTTGTDEDTVASLTQSPAITLVKHADDSGVQAVPQVGDPITYSFTITNTGNVTLTNVTLTDVLAGLVLTGDPIATLAPGAVDTATYSGSYALTQTDIDAGRVENQATVTGTPPTGADVSDVSGTAQDNDMVTTVPITQVPGITLLKEAQDAVYQTVQAVAGDPLDYHFTVTNTGNVTLTNVTLTDPLPGVVLSGSPLSSLAPGAVDDSSITGRLALTQAHIDAGEVLNTATVTGDYSDLNDDPQQVSDDSSDVAIVAAIEALPETFPAFDTDGGTTTSMLASDTVVSEPATLANVTIRVIAEDAGVTLDPNTALITLAPGHPAGAYDVTYEICSVAYPAICDQATETVVQNPIESIEAVKSQVLVDNGDGIDGVGDRVDYTITVTNTGNVPLSGVTVVDVLTTRAGTPLSLDSGPDFVSADMGSGEGALAIGEVATYTASYTLTIQAVTEGGLSNTVTAEGTAVYPPMFAGTPPTVSDVSDDDIDSDGNTSDDPTELVLAAVITDQGMTITKTTPRGVVERGSVVPYTITVENENVFVSGTVDILDVLPDGQLYVDGSATFEGAPHPVLVDGRVIRWDDIPLPPLTTVTLTLSARVLSSADVGAHINRATVRHPTDDTLLAEEATATVRILPEPVFDCGDVIGKVFEDENRDGYQNEGEAGLPAVRLIGVDGTIITTDEHGRFHVPCAMLPADRGGNFILKLDTRSLPAGYRITTENPRVIRLTPGKMSEMNFGAAITRVVRVDLVDAAFVTGADGRVRLSEPLMGGIATLLPQIKDEAVHLRLAYHLGEAPTRADKQRARRHMQLVARHLRQEWPALSQVKLTIERTFVETRK